jgi:maltose O-acetyltransferase
MTRHFVNLFLWLLPPSRLFIIRNFFLKICNIRLGSGVSICGRGWIYGRGDLQISDFTWISPGVIFFTHVDVEISIGSNCDIGPGVKFITGSHLSGNEARRAGHGIALPIHIGNGCWIGAGSIILGGVTIGDGAIVAAGTVVNKDCPANVLIAGVPAQVKRALLN